MITCFGDYIFEDGKIQVHLLFSQYTNVKITLTDLMNGLNLYAYNILIDS